MQEIEQVIEGAGADRKRVEAVVQTLASVRSKGEGLAEVAHDARNMVTALGLYCDLLEVPGVLAAPFLHYGSELRLVAAASRRLVERLVALDYGEPPESLRTGANMRERASLHRGGASALLSQQVGRWEMMPARPVDNLAAELMASRNLLAALAGPSIVLTVDARRCELPVRMTCEDLTRILVNLVKNAVEAMPMGGRIQLCLRESPTAPGDAPCLTLTVEDNGLGIPRDALEKVFEARYSTQAKTGEENGNGRWPGTQRGLGLSITRSIVEAAGGRIHAANRDPAGACLQIELPVRAL